MSCIPEELCLKMKKKSTQKASVVPNSLPAPELSTKRQVVPCNSQSQESVGEYKKKLSQRRMTDTQARQERYR